MQTFILFLILVLLFLIFVLLSGIYSELKKSNDIKQKDKETNVASNESKLLDRIVNRLDQTHLSIIAVMKYNTEIRDALYDSINITKKIHKIKDIAKGDTVIPQPKTAGQQFIDDVKQNANLQNNS